MKCFIILLLFANYVFAIKREVYHFASSFSPDGVPIHYTVYLCPEVALKNPAFLIHGLFITSYSWKALGMRRCQSDGMSVMINQRGHGSGDHASVRRMPNPNDDLPGLAHGVNRMAALDIDVVMADLISKGLINTSTKFDLVGHSLGTRTIIMNLAGFTIKEGKFVIDQKLGAERRARFRTISLQGVWDPAYTPNHMKAMAKMAGFNEAWKRSLLKLFNFATPDLSPTQIKELLEGDKLRWRALNKALSKVNIKGLYNFKESGLEASQFFLKAVTSKMHEEVSQSIVELFTKKGTSELFDQCLKEFAKFDGPVTITVSKVDAITPIKGALYVIKRLKEHGLYNLTSYIFSDAGHGDISFGDRYQALDSHSVSILTY